ncbi:MAG: phage major capsid protein [Desulfobacterales bacterium]|nr:phage major capsid protein [Desulfobacterales bacterium]
MDELKKMIEDMNKAFQAFKAEILGKIQALEARGAADPTLADELKSITSKIEALSKLSEQVEKVEKVLAKAEFPGGSITMADAPIYRGSKASALGQQALDIYLVGANVSREIKNQAVDRLEKNTKRCLALIEKAQGEVSKDFMERSMRPLADAGTGATMDGAPSDGGFLLQSETSMDLMTHGFNNGEVTRRTAKRTITGSDSLEIIGIDETSRADGSRGGGIRVYTDAELDQMTSSKTKFSKVKIEPERLTGLCYVSDKLLKNATFLGQELSQLFNEEFLFKVQDLVVNGVGAGQALGILNAACLISITAETGQEADTILSENVLKMYARFSPSGNGGGLVWLANRNTFTQLYTMTYDIGTGGELARLYIPPSVPGGTGSMLGYPVLFIEQAASIGDVGDLILCDLSQYICADYGNVDEASSIHLKFDYGQTTFRFVYYFDGQPRWTSALTPYKGTGDTISPFVAIAAR